MDKTSGRNFVIGFFPKSLSIGQKSSKTVIALKGKSITAHPFRLFLLSLGPTYGQDITSKAISKLVTLLRKLQRYSQCKEIDDPYLENIARSTIFLTFILSIYSSIKIEIKK